VEYIKIHKRLFTGIYKLAGKIRSYDISKKEWVLNGKSVMYAGAYLLREALEHDFAQEKAFNYGELTSREKVEHVAKFISNIWQIHIFGEGNTRTTAVFAIKYLCTFGFEVNNEAFEQNSYYFRNSLVRANFNDFRSNIVATQEYLNKFFYNLLLGEQNELKSRNLHVSFKTTATDVVDNVADDVVDNKILIINLIKDNPKISVKKIAEKIRLSHRQCQRIVADLKAKGIIEHVGSDNSGYWKVVDND
jgi:fido (protein-threonine AMPylation protein)